MLSGRSAIDWRAALAQAKPMGLIILVTGIFAGLFVFMTTVYSLGQAMLSDGWIQRAHLASLLVTLVVMGALYEKQVPLARAVAFLLFAIALWTFWLEERWFKIFPVLTQLFALALIAGFVAL
ncbi:MAG: hypothetical protein AAF675_18025 [Pseudomonadota bacterium]